MTWGFHATNINGQVLVSSDTRNLHFAGKATLDRIIKSSDGYGGLRHYAFRINCRVTPVPFFSMPTYDRYGVLAVRNVSGTLWEIEVLRSGVGNAVPEVYVFCDPRGITSPPTTNYGMQVMRDDGTMSFDSRYNPLVVAGGIQVAPPSNPLTVTPPTLSAKQCGGDASNYLGPNNENSYFLSTTATKPIYFYPSIAQAQREFEFHEWQDVCDGLSAYGACIGYSRSHDWWSNYWAFYRGAIRAVGGYLYAGWITAEFGCHWRQQDAGAILGIGIGGGSTIGGKWPYSNETLNLAPTAVVVSNGTRYD